MKDDFLTTVSHELRTPLTTILGLSEVLHIGGMGPLEDRQKDSVRKIHEQSQALARVINQLLEIRALTHRHVAMELAPLSLRDLIESCLHAVRESFSKKGVALEFSGNGDPLWVLGSRDILGRVLDQIIANALKFTPAGGAVKVEAKAAALTWAKETFSYLAQASVISMD